MPAYWMGQQKAAPDWVSAGVAGGESAVVMGEARGGITGGARGGVTGGARGGVTRGVERRHNRRRRLPA